jgi:hypothetical protein
MVTRMCPVPLCGQTILDPCEHCADACIVCPREVEERIAGLEAMHDAVLAQRETDMRAALRDIVEHCGAMESDDPNVPYVLVRMPREVWQRLDAARRG